MVYVSYFEAQFARKGDLYAKILKVSISLLLICAVARSIKENYYSTIASFYHIWSRERAKYETVIHCSVPV